MKEQRTKKQELRAIVEQLELERNKWRGHWMELSDYIAPECGAFSFSEDKANDGRISRHKVLDGHPGRVARDFAAGMQSVATPKSRPWFRTGTHDVEMMEFPRVKTWLKTVDDVLRFMFAQSNLYTVLPTVYFELGVFGTASTGVFDSFDTVLRFRHFTAGEYMLSRNSQGVVDTFARQYWMTARQMVQEFGRANVSAAVQSAYEGSHAEQWFPVVHVIRPNREVSRKSPFASDKSFKSCYYEPDRSRDDLLLETGFDYFPFLCPTANRVSTRVYGHGMGTVALPDIKSLYKLKEKTFLAVDKAVDPPLVASGSMKREVISSMPGGVSFDTDVQSTQLGLRPLYEVRPDLNGAWATVQDLRDQIGSAFYHDLFLMLAMTDRREITATEVAERHEEKLLMLAPLSEAIHSELLDPLIDIAFQKALDNGLLPPPPEELAGEELKVEYIDILTQAQKMVGITANEQLAGFVGNLSAVFPEVRHKFNSFEAVDDYANRLGTVPSIIRSDDEANEMAAAEQQRMAQMQAMEQAGAAAQSAKVMSETDVGGGTNALQALIGGIAQ